MLEYLKTHSKIRYSCYGLLAVLVLLMVIWHIAVSKTVEIFNLAVSRQNIFKGKIYAEALKCDYNGVIRFKNLCWDTEQGEPIVKIPDGRLIINPLDIITLHVTPNSLKVIELHDASFKLHFDEKMKLDVLKQEPSAKTETKPKQGKEKAERNLNLPDNLPNWKVVLQNCSITAYRQKRIYALDKVNCVVAVKKHSLVDVDFVGNSLGGTMIGKSFSLKGQIDTVPDTVKLKLSLEEIVPASLGLGKLSDAVTLTGDIHGRADRPIITGDIKFSKLDLHTMVFTDVTSRYYYKDDIVTFTNTKGNVWGGYVNASGKYNVDTRRYRIDAVGTDIALAQATRQEGAEGRGKLYFTLLCDPMHKEQAITGHVEIGKGKFKAVHFHKIEGDVFVHNKTTYLKDLKVVMGLGHVTSKLLSIENGKVNRKPVPPNEGAIIAELEDI